MVSIEERGGEISDEMAPSYMASRPQLVDSGRWALGRLVSVGQSAPGRWEFVERLALEQWLEFSSLQEPP